MNLKVAFDKAETSNFDDKSKKEMIKELAIINGLIPDDTNEVDDLDAYFRKLGI